MSKLNNLVISGFSVHPQAFVDYGYKADVLNYQDFESIDSIGYVGNYNKIIAWSLGGIVASHLISSKKLNTEKLVLFNCPENFVHNKYGIGDVKFKASIQAIKKSCNIIIQKMYADITQNYFKENYINFTNALYWFEFLSNSFLAISTNIEVKNYVGINDSIVNKNNSPDFDKIYCDSDHMMPFKNKELIYV